MSRPSGSAVLAVTTAVALSGSGAALDSSAAVLSNLVEPGSGS
ncbi:hypothetical protein [Nocardia aurantia]|uniref:Uncharacterized protein n=1 Tax=Nocardia aurantia TaxID=2585199 RepID=A0A7K0DPS9_9NOCA|nr:hypothetical protein [Nocardia aurantia]MQY27607.1 hypothetical protein [Nocardia aurantia]